MSSIAFNPWIGINYGQSQYGKLLIVGDSHYFKNGLPADLPEFTKSQIAELDIISSNFHDTVRDTFGHKKHRDFWENIAFANGIQSPFSAANQIPTTVELANAECALKEYLKITKPEKVIVFSSRLWEHFFNKPGWGKHYGKINDRWNIRDLNYEGGMCRALGVYHPSARDFHKKDFANVIKEFLDRY